MDIENGISQDNDRVRQSLITFLCNITNPAFGIHTKKELEFLIFELMINIDLIDSSSLFTLMTELGITKAKASQFVYDYEVRRLQDKNQLDEKLKSALINANFTQDGNYFVMDIEAPLLRAYIKEKIKEIGHVADGSFGQSIVRMNINGVTDLITYYIEDNQKEKVKNKLLKAGAPDTSLKGILKSGLKTLGSKVLGEAAGELLNNVPNMISGLFSSEINETDWKPIFKTEKKKSK